jgi:hypothetical protein
VETLSPGECPGFAKEATMLKCIRLTALATAVAVLRRSNEPMNGLTVTRAFRVATDVAKLRTAVALTDEERQMLSAKLKQALRSRQVVLEEIVDRMMLGGFIAEGGGVVLDGSLEGQLERMRRRLVSS